MAPPQASSQTTITSPTLQPTSREPNRRVLPASNKAASTTADNPYSSKKAQPQAIGPTNENSTASPISLLRKGEAKPGNSQETSLTRKKSSGNLEAKPGNSEKKKQNSLSPSTGTKQKSYELPTKSSASLSGGGGADSIETPSIPLLKRSSSYTVQNSSVGNHNVKKDTKGGPKFSRPKGSAFQKKRPLDEKSISYKLLEEIVNSTITQFIKHDGILSHRDLRLIITKKIALVKSIHDNIIGSESVFRTPFGTKKYLPITYCDYIASGKPLKMIEDYIMEQVLPTYANTHTTTSFTGYQTTHLREDARQMIAQSVNARINKPEQPTVTACYVNGECVVEPNSQNDLDEDVIIFAGSGSTAAINTLIHCIAIKQHVLAAPSEKELPVVIISTLEHHSNILAWRETGACVIQIMEDKYGGVDLDELQVHLKQFKDSGRMLIVSMTAASNVTGVCTNTDAIAKLAHENNAWCFFDYAGGAPYLNIDVNPNNDPLLAKDAVFISPHKFIGGPGTPGVLIAKKKLFCNSIPSQPGGGTVTFVNTNNHKYTQIIEEKEEGGTPNIIGSIRCALVFKLKDEVGPKLIQRIEEKYRDRALKFWSSNPNLIMVGPGLDCIGEGKVEKLAFFSFLIKHEEYFLHPSFVSLLLNDLFGIQSRPGCSCAGPYGVSLLGIPETKMNLLEAGVAEKLMWLKPGWSRLNLNYFFDDNTVQFVLKAVDFVATNGWKLLPYYFFDAKTNEWTHRKFGNSSPMRLSGYFDNFTTYTEQNRKKLTDVSFSNGFLEFVDKNGELLNTEPTAPLSYTNILKEAESVLRESTNNFGALYINIESELNNLFGDEELGLRHRYGHLRWFLLPSEALMDMKGIEREKVLTEPVIIPKMYPSSDSYIKQKKIESRTYLKSRLNK